MSEAIQRSAHRGGDGGSVTAAPMAPTAHRARMADATGDERVAAGDGRGIMGRLLTQLTMR
jgi:hypothetical protein